MANRRLFRIAVFGLVAVCGWPSTGWGGGRLAPAITSCQIQEALDRQELNRVAAMASQACEAAASRYSMFDSERRGETDAWGLSVLRCMQGLGDGIIEGVAGLAHLVSGTVSCGTNWATQSVYEAFEGSGGTGETMDADTDDISALRRASAESIERDAGCIAKIQAAIAAVQAFFADFRAQMQAQWAGYQCLPPSLQAYLGCKVASAVGFDPLLIIGGTVKLARYSKGIAALMIRLKESQVLTHASDLIDADKVARASAVIKEGARSLKEGVVIQRIGTAQLSKVTDEVMGGVRYVLERKVDGIWERIPVDYHPELGAIAARSENETGKMAMRLHLEHLAKGSTKTRAFAISIDINNLGLINYFRGGMKTADKYLEAVTKAFRSKLRGAEDVLYRRGGDEFALLVQAASPEEVIALQRKLVEAAAESPEAVAAIRTQLEYASSRVPELRAAKSFDDFSPALREYFNVTDPAAMAREFPDFAAYRAGLEKALLDDIQGLEKMKPGISIGAAEIHAMDSAEDVLERADGVAARMKTISKVLYEGKSQAEVAKKYRVHFQNPEDLAAMRERGVLAPDTGKSSPGKPEP